MNPDSPDVVDLGVLSALAPELAATFAAVASDIALVIDHGGVIRHMAAGEGGLAASASGWIGRAWVDTVTRDTRRKIELLLAEAAEGRASRRREVAHPSGQGDDIPVAWAAVRLGANGPVLAVGRDMRAVAAIQQRFIDAQQEIERDYWRRRQAESHYRLLFQVANDAVLVVDAQTMHVLEANRAAVHLFSRPMEHLVGQLVTVGVHPLSRAVVDELLRMARSSGRPGEVRVRLLVSEAEQRALERAPLIDVSATPFRAPQSGVGDSAMLLLVRARVVDAQEAGGDELRRLADFVERTPDGIVVTDAGGRILVANPAFLTMVGELPQAMPLTGRALGEVLADVDARLPPLMMAVRRQGLASRVELRLRDPQSVDGHLELSAALLAEGDQECIGFTLRRLPGELRNAPPLVNELVQTLGSLGEQLDARLGGLPLPRLLGQAARVAERHLIGRALERSGGDAAKAARLLGITEEMLAQRRRRVQEGEPPLVGVPSDP